MTEPLTDEEFEALKKEKYCYEQCERTRFIATIELQKSDKALGAALVRRVQELKAELEARMDVYVACRRGRKKAEEENTKLKEEARMVDQLYTKLKAELETRNIEAEHDLP